MAKVKLREAAQTSENGAAGRSAALNPLRVSGVVVGKADLIQALRVYLNLRDIQVTEDGETFILLIEEGAGGEDSTAQ